MDKGIHLRVKKDLDIRQHKSVLELKGCLIAKGYTDIIHIDDEVEDYHINSFSILPKQKTEVLEYITLHLSDNELHDIVVLV